MTKEERHLWYDFLKNLPDGFRRQKVVGHYIVDFYCASSKLIIELDGSQHCEQDAKNSDAARDMYMNSLGFRVLRYSNQEVNQNFNGVCEDILRHLKPSP